MYTIKKEEEMVDIQVVYLYMYRCRGSVFTYVIEHMLGPPEVLLKNTYLSAFCSHIFLGGPRWSVMHGRTSKYLRFID